jgi:cyclic dehypoxanthinyl futalosine synthase
MRRRLRAAAVSFLNARPLTVGLERSERIELVLDEPSRCAAMLEAGEVDMALVSVGGLDGREYEIVPGIAIGADGPVQTVVLAGEQSPVVWDEVFLDTASCTAVVLTKVLLDEMGVRPRYTPMPAEEGVARARGTKGALVIGDRAFDVRANRVLDLGREWTELTKLPMIFALWAARPGALGPEDVREITRAAQAGLGMRTEIAQAFAREKGGDPERYRRYLTQRIRYGLGPYELQGLEAFLAKATAKGFLPPTKLRFADDRVRTARARRRVSLDAALEKGARGERLDADEAELLDEQAPILELGLAADQRRRALHGDGVVTYIVSRNVNYTNVCTTACHFCAFYRPRGHAEAYVLGREELAAKLDETVRLGGIEILMQGGLHPDLGIGWYEDLFRWVKRGWPTINLHALSPEEIWHIARTSDLSLDDAIDRLVAAGLDSIPGGGAEILHDEIRRRIAPLKCSTDEWLTVMRAAHRKGLKSTATLMFGVGEEPVHRVAHLARLRDLQDETGGFTAFICWPFQPANTRLAPGDGSAHAYLRTNALARLFLDNVPNLQSSWVTMGGGVAQAALHMGCNDFGQVMMEENVVSAAGTSFRMDAEDVERHIRDAGFRPVRRNMKYERLGGAAPSPRPSPPARAGGEGDAGGRGGAAA